jgi:methyl-accepting chemotaxis protein
MLLITGAIFIGIITLCLLIVTGLLRSLKMMIANFKDIAEGEGDLTKRVTIDSKDEIGELAGWFNLFLEKLQGIVKTISGHTVSSGCEVGNLKMIASSLSRSAQDTSGHSNTLVTAAEEMAATIEAARAGEAGKGFAVVANEIIRSWPSRLPWLPLISRVRSTRYSKPPPAPCGISRRSPRSSTRSTRSW